MTRTLRQSSLLLLASLALAACGGSSPSSSPGGELGTSRALRGAITAKDASSITVNGVRLSTEGATLRSDDTVVGQSALQEGMVVTVKGGFDDRIGSATEVEIEHGIEGRVDDKGTDFVRIGGQTVRVDDTTEFGEDNPARLGSIAVGDVVAVSGVPDDKGGLRASRVDDSLRNGGVSSDDDDLDVKGFVSSLSGSSFQLRSSPDSVAYWMVDASGSSLPAGLGNGAYVEVHTLSAPLPASAPVLGTIVASRIELEDRFGESEVEVEGIVTSGSDAQFVVDGVTVRTDASTRWELGAPADLVPGVKVEAEGRLDAEGVLHAEKVSFRPGVRLTAVIESYDGASMSLLGVHVQLPSFMDNDFGALANGLKVEVRGNPSADGTGIVAYRVTDPSGNESRVFVRAVATAKSSATFTVMGFEVQTGSASLQLDTNGDGVKESVSASVFFAAVEPGHTVLKVRAASAADVDLVSRTIVADEIELEGND